MNGSRRPTNRNTSGDTQYPLFSTKHLSSFRPKRLVLCLAAALVSHASIVPAASPHPHYPHAAKHNPDHPNAPQTWIVQTCYDDGVDSLREIIGNPAKAQSGDTIDLSQLPTQCGTTDSSITLTTGEIVITQNDLTLEGPDHSSGTVTISGGGAYRVLHHEGSGALTINSLTIADGNYHAATNAYGGCVESDLGNIYLNSSVVTGCALFSDMNFANGGGVSALLGDVTLFLSSVSGNQATAPTQSFGGGVYAHGKLSAKYSSIRNNAVHGSPSNDGSGGGAYAGSVKMYGSTIDNNSAKIGSGLGVGTITTISNSTISSNIASGYGALRCRACDATTIANSTIAFNQQNSTTGGAVAFGGLAANSVLTLQSSIIANNTAGPGNIPADLYITPGYGVLSATGIDNLVIASNIASPPPGVITVTTDPKLGPLQLNGGMTRTHALLSGSPALSVGNNLGLWSNDQRGDGYPRTTGPGASVDIGAVQFDTIFVGRFELQ